MALRSIHPPSITTNLPQQETATLKQPWKQLDAEEVQRTARLLDAWKIEVERRINKLFLHKRRKEDWQRARNPRVEMGSLTWQKHVNRLLTYLQDDWNSELSKGEEAITLSREVFLKGPPNRLMQPNTSADLQEMPRLTSASVAHLFGHLNDLRTRVEQAQTSGHITAERTLRDAIATTLESLEAWESAAQELEHVVQINEALADFTYVARALLRKGKALYRSGHFEEARKTLERAVDVLGDRLPRNAALRTEVRVWDYLGLCYVRIGDPAKALKIFLDKGHQRRSRQHSTPLGDASRSVRIGIAYLELGEGAKAKEAFLKGLHLRIELQAFAEAALALRYLGFFYLRGEQLVHALSIWDIALKVQRGVGDEVEQTKLHFFRGSVWQQLLELSNRPGGVVSSERIECGFSDKLFPNAREREMLNTVAKRFRDPCRTYLIRNCLAFAHAAYQQCVEIGSRRNLIAWVSGAESALKSLPSITRS